MEWIESVVEAERRAEDMQRQAAQDARERLRQAGIDVRAASAQWTQQARERTAELLSEAQAQAQEETLQIAQLSRQECDAWIARCTPLLGRAVERIVERIVQDGPG